MAAIFLGGDELNDSLCSFASYCLEFGRVFEMYDILGFPLKDMDGVNCPNELWE